MFPNVPIVSKDQTGRNLKFLSREKIDNSIKETIKENDIIEDFYDMINIKLTLNLSSIGNKTCEIF